MTEVDTTTTARLGAVLGVEPGDRGHVEAFREDLNEAGGLERAKRDLARLRETVSGLSTLTSSPVAEAWLTDSYTVLCEAAIVLAGEDLPGPA